MFTWGYFALSFCSSARSIVACSCREGGGGIFSAESSTFFSSIFSLTQTWHVKLQKGKDWSMTSVVNKSRVILTDFKMKDKAFKRLVLRASTRFLQSFPLKYPFQKLKVFSCNTASNVGPSLYTRIKINNLFFYFFKNMKNKHALTLIQGCFKETVW